MGVEQAVRLGADIVVNTDADNQYCGADNCQAGGADSSTAGRHGDWMRPIIDHPEFGPLKKLLQLLGSWLCA